MSEIKNSKSLWIGVGFAVALAACGGGGGGDGGDNDDPSGVDRTIDLSGASSPYPIEDPEDVAKIAYALSGTASLLIGVAGSVADDSSKSTETEPCEDGGQIVYEVDDSPPTIGAEIDFEQCASGNAYSDGHLDMKCTYNVSSNKCNPVEFTFGEGETALMFEGGAMAEGGQRALIYGLASGTADIELATQTFSGLTLNLLLKAAVEPLEGGARTSVGLTDYDIVVDTVDPNFRVSQEGTFLVDGGCGTGTGLVQTDEPMLIDRESGMVVAGELGISHESGNDSAAIVFNSNGTVTVTSDNGASDTYTEEQLAALCSLR